MKGSSKNDLRTQENMYARNLTRRLDIVLTPSNHYDLLNLCVRSFKIFFASILQGDNLTVHTI